LNETTKDGKQKTTLAVLLRDPVRHSSGRLIQNQEMPDWVKRHVVTGTVEEYG
jgi:hypothetical protein